MNENNYRERYIITPTDEYSFNQLDTGEIPSNFFKVDLDNTEFLYILKSGIIDEINFKLNIFIDDFEQIVISEKERLVLLLTIVNSFKDNNSTVLYSVLKKTETAIKLAIQNNTGVFFMF